MTLELPVKSFPELVISERMSRYLDVREYLIWRYLLTHIRRPRKKSRIRAVLRKLEKEAAIMTGMQFEMTKAARHEAGS